jgi:hypothetical protein
VITLDAGRLAVGRVYYTSWCVERGRVLEGRTDVRIDWKALNHGIGHADVAFTMKQYVQSDL